MFRKHALALIAALLIAAPIYAQDVVETPAPDSGGVDTLVTDEGGGGDVTVEDGGTVVITDPAPTFDTSSLFGLAAAIFVAIAGGGTFLEIVKRLLGSKDAQDNTERLFEGLSPTWQGTIERIIDVAEQLNETAREAIQFARRVTDGLPNEPPPQEGDTARFG